MPHISTPTCALPCRQTGFSLLEALITLLIVSLGLLGIAGIIATSLKVNQGAYFRTVASLQAADIIDRMRANRGNAPQYALAGCNALPAIAGVPADDLTDWCANVALALPAGGGSVEVVGNQATVSVTWDDSRAQNAPANGEFALEVQL